jgi:hypothetical protein
MDFGDALRLMAAGRKVARADWNAPWQYVMLIEAGTPASGINGQPVQMSRFMLLHTAQDEYVPWTVSQTDALGDDWIEAAT